jgi:hypothetical protein
MLVRETASAIADLNLDPAGLVVACRRIVERHPTSGPLWWLCAKLTTSTDPFREAWGLADHIEDDPTANQLVDLVPENATVLVVGWPDLAGETLIRRGDVTALVVDCDDSGSSLVRRLRRADVDAEEVPPAGVAAAVRESDLVLIEALAAGPDAALCALGSHAAAAVAYCNEIPVWLVAGRGRRLPEPMWNAMVERIGDSDEAWLLDVESVPLGLVSAVAGPDGLCAADSTALLAECPTAPELLRSSAL